MLRKFKEAKFWKFGPSSAYIWSISSELVQNDCQAASFGRATLTKDAEADMLALGNVPLLQKVLFWSPASIPKLSKREGRGMSDTASSATATSLQHHACINGKISCHCLGNELTWRHLWCPWFERSDMPQVTPQDCRGRWSNHQLLLMKEWKSTLLLAGLLAGSCIRCTRKAITGVCLGKEDCRWQKRSSISYRGVSAHHFPLAQRPRVQERKVFSKATTLRPGSAP